ncbi:MAG: FkbM family methyltransferase [Pseudomonadota bacterium]
MFSYIKRTAKQLASAPAFRHRPISTSGRVLSYGVASLLGRDLQFRLSRNGAKMRISAGQKQSGFTSAYILRDMAEVELFHLDRFLPEGGCFFDCGANIGIYSLKAATLVGQAGTVVSFEPSQISFSRLKANVELNAFPQVELRKCAVSDHPGTATLYHGGGGPNAYSLVNKGGAQSHETVETTTIDAIVDVLAPTRLDVIKLDVEGAEPAALRGARRTLERFRPVVIFENILLDDMNSAVAIDDMHCSFDDLNYRYHRFESGRLVPTEYAKVYGNIVAMPD